MSVMVMGLVWNISGLTSSEKLVLLAYADHASHDGTGIWPAVLTVAKKTSLSERTVQRVTKELEKMGCLVKDGHHKSGTNMWKIPIPDIGGDMVTPPGVTEDHLPPDTVTPGGVTGRHQGGDGVTPKPSINHYKESSNETLLKELLSSWKELFPNKPQPRESSRWAKTKVNARSKDKHFLDIWRDAMYRASQSTACQIEEWFHLEFFLRNDQNYQKCYDRWMAWKDREYKKGGRTFSDSNSEEARSRYVEGEYADFIEH